jgi:hypothetical protein
MSPLRFRLSLLCALLVGALLPAEAGAQNYPDHPITVIVPFAVGGLTDVPVRVLAGMLQERIGQNVIVENKPGGSGTLGGAYAARAAPDGYTLFANSIADAQNLYFIPVPYNAIDDFAMIGMIVEGPPLVLIVDTTLPYKSLAELLADAKVNPNRISFGTSGPATSPAMALAQLNCSGQDRDRGSALRRLGRGRPQRVGKWRSGCIRVLRSGQAARRWRQSARARRRSSATDCDLVRGADHAGGRVSQFRL